MLCTHAQVAIATYVAPRCTYCHAIVHAHTCTCTCIYIDWPPRVSKHGYGPTCRQLSPSYSSYTADPSFEFIRYVYRSYSSYTADPSFEFIRYVYSAQNNSRPALAIGQFPTKLPKWPCKTTNSIHTCMYMYVHWNCVQFCQLTQCMVKSTYVLWESLYIHVHTCIMLLWNNTGS